MSQELSDKEISNAFDKLKIIPETESSSKENSGNLDNGIKTMVLDSIVKLRGKKKRPDIESIFDFLSKTVATNIDKDTLADSISHISYPISHISSAATDMRYFARSKLFRSLVDLVDKNNFSLI